MPLYEYRCDNNHLFEVFHEVGGTPGPCPVCGAAARRIFTSVGLVFKGSGFHTTDYRKRGVTDGAAGKDSADKDSADKDSAGKDSSAKNSSAAVGKSGEAATSD